MRLEPLREKIGDAVRKSDNRAPREGRPSPRGGTYNSRGFSVRQPWNDRRHVHAYRDTRLRERANGLKPFGRGRGTRLQSSRELGVKSGNGNNYRCGLIPRQLGEQIAVACDERILRHDCYGIAKINKHFETTASEL